MAACDFRIIDYNYPFQDNVYLTASSEDISYPVTNLAHHFKSRVFKSNKAGYFKIISTNKFLDFKIGGGELTATLVENEYTATTLAAHIATRMTLAAGTTILCTYSTSTGKFTISKAAGTLQLLWDTGTNTTNSVGSALGFDDSSDYIGALTYSSAHVASNTEEFAIIDLRTEEAIDTFYMLFDPLSGNKISSQGAIYLQANATSNFDSPAFSQLLTFDEERGVYSHIFTTDQSYRYWKIKIVDPTNANVQSEFGKVILGKSTTLSRGPEIGFVYKLKDLSQSQTNGYGNTYVDSYPMVSNLEMNFKLLVEADMNTLIDMFNRNGVSTPMLWIIDAQEAIFDKDRFVIYGRMENDLSFKHIISEYFETSIKITEAL